MADTGSGDAATRRSLSRYDLVLAVIPTALLGPALLARLLQLGLEAGLVIGAVVGALALIDAVLLNPPRRPRSGGSAA